MFDLRVPVDVPGGSLYGRIIGLQGKPFVILHGGPGMTHDYFLPDMQALCQSGYQIFMYDQRGCGYSKESMTNPDAINIDTYIKDFEAFCARFELKDITLMGHSWGGLLAVRCAAAYPELVTNLILVNPMPLSSEGYADFVAQCTKRLEPYQEELGIVRRSDQYREGEVEAANLYYSLIFRAYFANHRKIEGLRSVPEYNKLMAPNWQRVEELFRKNLISKPFDFHEDLSKITANTLFIHGDADPTPREWIDKMRAMIPDSKFREIEKAGHFPWVEQPSKFFLYVQVFLVQVSMAQEVAHSASDVSDFSE